MVTQKNLFENKRLHQGGKIRKGEETCDVFNTQNERVWLLIMSDEE